MKYFKLQQLITFFASAQELGHQGMCLFEPFLQTAIMRKQELEIYSPSRHFLLVQIANILAGHN